MIGKVGLGSLAKGILDYCQYDRLDKGKADKADKAVKTINRAEVRGELVFSQGLIIKKGLNGAVDTSFLAEQMNREAGHARLKKFVWHQSFSLPPGQDVSDETIGLMCEDFCSHFGFTENQVIAFRHRDKAHPHFHIIANRISDGKCTASDSNNFIETGRLSRKIEEKYGLAIGQAMYKDRLDAKQSVEILQSQPSEQLRLVIDQGLLLHKNLADLKKHVEKSGYKVYVSSAGISFTEKQQGISIKGSALGRGYSKANLEKKMAGTFQSPVAYYQATTDRVGGAAGDQQGWLDSLRTAIDKEVGEVANWQDLNKALAVHGFGLKVGFSNAIKYTHLSSGKTSTGLAAGLLYSDAAVVAGFGQERSAFCENYGKALFEKSVSDFYVQSSNIEVDALVEVLHGQGFLANAGDNDDELRFKIGVLAVPIPKKELSAGFKFISLKERYRLAYCLDKALAAVFVHVIDAERSIPKAIERLNHVLLEDALELKVEKGNFLLKNKALGMTLDCKQLGPCFEDAVLAKRIFEDSLSAKDLAGTVLNEANIVALYQIRSAIDDFVSNKNGHTGFENALLSQGIKVLQKPLVDHVTKTERVYCLNEHEFTGKQLGLAYQDYNLGQRFLKDSSVVIKDLAFKHQVQKCLDRVLLSSSDFEDFKTKVAKQGLLMNTEGITHVSTSESLLWKQLSPLYQERFLKLGLGKSYQERLLDYRVLTKVEGEEANFRQVLKATLYQQLPLVSNIAELKVVLLQANILLKEDAKGAFSYENLSAVHHKGFSLKGYQLGDNGIFNDKSLVFSFGKERAYYQKVFDCVERLKGQVNQARESFPSSSNLSDFISHFNAQHQGLYVIKPKEEFGKTSLGYEAVFEHEGKRFRLRRDESSLGGAFKATYLQEHLGLKPPEVELKARVLVWVRDLMDKAVVQTRGLSQLENVLSKYGVEVRFSNKAEASFSMKINLPQLNAWAEDKEYKAVESRPIIIHQAQSLGDAYHGRTLLSRLGRSAVTFASEQEFSGRLRLTLDKLIPQHQNWFSLSDALVKELGVCIVSEKDQDTHIAKAVYWHGASKTKLLGTELGFLYEDYHVEKRFGLEKGIYQDFLKFKQSLRDTLEDLLPIVPNQQALQMQLKQQGFKVVMVNVHEKEVLTVEHEASKKTLGLAELSPLYSVKALERSYGVARVEIVGQLQFEAKVKSGLDSIIPQVSSLSEVKDLMKEVFGIKMSVDGQGKLNYQAEDGTGPVCKGEDLGRMYEDVNLSKGLGMSRDQLGALLKEPKGFSAECAWLRGIFLGSQIIVPQNDQYKIMKSLRATLDVTMKKHESREQGLGF